MNKSRKIFNYRADTLNTSRWCAGVN